MAKKFVKVIGIHNIFNATDKVYDFSAIKDSYDGNVSDLSVIYIESDNIDETYSIDGHTIEENEVYKFVWTRGKIYSNYTIGECKLTKNVTSEVAIGGIAVGDVLNKGLSFQDFVEKLLTVQ